MIKQPKLILPHPFDIKLLVDLYFKEKTIKVPPRYYVSSLSFISKEIGDPPDLTENILKIIDSKIKCIRKYNYVHSDYAPSTVSSHCGRVLQLFQCLFEYDFAESKTSRQQSVLLNKNADLSCIDVIPRLFLNYTDTDPKLFEIIKKVQIFMEGRNCSKSYQGTILRGFNNTLVPLRDAFVNQTVTREMIIDQIQNVENEKTKPFYKSRNPVYEANDASYVVRHACRSFNMLMASGVVPFLVECKPIQPIEIKVKKKEIERVTRDYFTDEELEKIADSYSNEKERLIFTLFLTVGLRIGGVMKLKIKNVFSTDMVSVLETGTAIEKGGKTRIFIIFPALKQALLQYKKSNYHVFVDPDYFLFPYKHGSSKEAHISKTTLNKIFKTVCTRAGVTGDQVHTHACRKTVVVNLMKDGNTIDHVAKFIGHSNPITTAQHYWVTTPSELVASMNISWLVGPAILNTTAISQNDKENETASSSQTRGPNLKQIQKIAVNIAEGFKAQERLSHAISIMSPDQLQQLEGLWTENSKESVADKTKRVMIEIAEAASTFASRTQSYNSQKDDSTTSAVNEENTIDELE